MKFMHLAGCAALAATLASAAIADPLPMDEPITVDGVETVCTGVGSAKDDPRWASYPIRVEFSNGAAQFLSGAQVTLSDSHGKMLTAVQCSGPWVLLRLPPGTYKVSATLTGEPGQPPRSATFSPPAHGQKRVEIQFPLQPNQ